MRRVSRQTTLRRLKHDKPDFTAIKPYKVIDELNKLYSWRNNRPVRATVLKNSNAWFANAKPGDTITYKVGVNLSVPKLTQDGKNYKVVKHRYNVPVIALDKNSLLDAMMNKDVIFKVTLGGYTRYLNRTLIEKLIDPEFYNHKYITKKGQGSDEWVIEDDAPITHITITTIKRKTYNKPTTGAFFPYINTSQITLNKYQIFNSVSADNYTENCFIHACIQSGIPKATTDVMKLMIRTNQITTKIINKISEVFNIDFTITYTTTTGNTKYKYYKVEDPKYRVVLLNVSEHWMINEKTDVTDYAIENNLSNSVISKSYTYKGETKQRITRDPTKGLFLSAVLQRMFEKGYFKPINTADREIYSTPHYGKISDDSALEYDDSDVQLISEYKDDSNYDYLNGDMQEYIKGKLALFAKYKESKATYQEAKDSNISNVVYFDFETYTIEENKQLVHKPFMCCWYINKDSRMYSSYGDDCGLDFINSLPKNPLCIAHNMTYDVSILLSNYKFTVLNNIRSGTRIKTLNIIHNKNYITFLDSYLYLSAPLSALPLMFKIDELQKEIMPYEFYTKENIEIRYHPVDTFVKACNVDISKLNIKPYIVNDKIDIIEYSKYYCMRDVDVLKCCYELFRYQMLLLFNEDILNTLTLPGLIYKVLVKNGIFDGVYQVSNVVREFIQRACIGGRCTLANNKIYNTNEPVTDLDANSLYPSAMKISNVCMGKPQVLTSEQLNLIFLNSTDEYFIEVDNMVFERKYDLSTLAMRTDEGLDWINEFPPETKFTLNKTYVELLLKFNNAKFRIIKGYYFKSGFNNRMNKFIDYLYQLRCELVKASNPMETIIKLTMNSAYGRTLMKPIETSDKFFSTREAADKYISNNLDYIIDEVSLGVNGYLIRSKKAIIQHFNVCHVAAEILAKSKLIMCQITCLDSLQGNVYYTDTDSIMLKYSCIDSLEREFISKYGYTFNGSQLGQLKVDIKLKAHHEGKDYKLPPSIVKSSHSIFVSKKVYMLKITADLQDVKKYFNDKGIDYLGEAPVHHHVRARGIPNSTMETLEAENAFESLYKGDSLKLNLSETSTSFKMGRDYKVTTNRDFCRVLRRNEAYVCILQDGLGDEC